MTETIIHLVLLLVLPPLLLGVINKTKAWFAGRIGPPLLQPYYDLVKLMRKGHGDQHDDDMGLSRRTGRHAGDRAAGGPADADRPVRCADRVSPAT